MNFSNRLSTIIEAEVGKRTFIIFAFLLTALGIISALEPSYTLIILIGSTILVFTVLSPKEGFLVTGIFLILQNAVTNNMDVFGAPETITNIVKRADEVIWVFFLVFLLLNNYRGKTWKFKKSLPDKFAITLAFVGLMSAFINGNSLFWTLPAIFLTLKGYLLFWIAMNMSIDKQKLIIFFKTLIVILLIIAFIGFLQYIGIKIFTVKDTERLGVRVVNSIFAHHGTFGSLMAVGIALSIGLKLGTKKNTWLITSIIFSLGLIISSVRRSLIGLILGLIFVFLFYRKFKIEKKYIYSFLGGLSILLILFGGRMARITTATKYEYGTNIAPRYWLYYGASRIIKNKPLLGEGPGKYGSFISVITKSEIYEKYNIIIENNYKMDAYWASILGEYGILGFTTMIFLLMVLFQNILHFYPKDNKTPFIKGLYIGYIILFIDFFIESIMASVFTISWSAFLFFAGIGLIIGERKSHSQIMI